MNWARQAWCRRLLVRGAVKDGQPTSRMHQVNRLVGTSPLQASAGPPAGFQGGERDEGGFSLFGFTELGKALLTTAVVVLVAAPIVSLIQRRRARRKRIAPGRNAPA